MIQMCDLCGGKFTGWGCNPQPLMGTVCCTECDKAVVIPARIAMAKRYDARSKNRGIEERELKRTVIRKLTLVE
jgi:hypothetical protein